jgi:type IV pilus assembly protein PilB
MPSKFGQLMLWANLITEEQLGEALEYQRLNGGRLGEILSKLGAISADDLIRTLGMKYGVPTVNLDHVKIDRQTLDLISGASARAHRLIPLNRSGSNLMCAMEDPARIDSINEIEFQTGCRLQPVLVTKEMMSSALDRHYPSSADSPRPRAKAASPAKSPLVGDLCSRIERLPREKLVYVQRFLDAIE